MSENEMQTAEEYDNTPCECPVCKRMLNEYGEPISRAASRMVAELSPAMAHNFSQAMIAMSETGLVTHEDGRAALAEVMVPGLVTVASTVLELAYTEGAPQPSRADVIAVLRRVMEARILYAVDTALENDAGLRARRDGKSMLGEHRSIQ